MGRAISCTGDTLLTSLLFSFLFFLLLFTLISHSKVVAHDLILFALATWIGFWIPYFLHFTYDYGCFWRWLSNGWKGRVYGWKDLMMHCALLGAVVAVTTLVQRVAV